jgi:hypothetical protein
MRIKNVGRSTIIFNGGTLESGKVAVFKDEGEVIGFALLKNYPDKLIDLDNIHKEDIVDVVIEAPEKAPKVAPVAKKKSKK